MTKCFTALPAPGPTSQSISGTRRREIAPLLQNRWYRLSTIARSPGRLNGFSTSAMRSCAVTAMRGYPLVQETGTGTLASYARGGLARVEEVGNVSSLKTVRTAMEALSPVPEKCGGGV